MRLRDQVRHDIRVSCGPERARRVTCIFPDGRIEVVVANKGDVPERFMTNGYALLPDGDFMIANLGPDGGCSGCPGTAFC